MEDIAAVRSEPSIFLNTPDYLLTIYQSAGIVLHIQRETSLHLTYCEGFGISQRQMEQTEERMACTAYTRCVLPACSSEPHIRPWRAHTD